MRHERLPVVVLLAFVLSIHAATSSASKVARDFDGGARPFLMRPPSPAVTATAIAAAQDPAVIEASLDLDRSTRRLIQQGLRNEGFDAGTPDGLFGPRTRGAIRDWQQSRGAPSTGYLSGTEAQLLRTTAAAPPPVAAGTSLPPQAVSETDPSALSAAEPRASTATADATAAPTPGAAEITPGTAGGITSERPTRTAVATGNAQLPPEIMIDRHLVRADRLLADDDPEAALEAMNEVLALQDDHDLVLEDDFHFQYAQVAFAAGRTERAIASLNQYLLAAGRGGEFYREALELLDSVEVRLRREEADRRRAEVERRRASRWTPRVGVSGL